MDMNSHRMTLGIHVERVALDLFNFAALIHATVRSPRSLKMREDNFSFPRRKLARS